MSEGFKFLESVHTRKVATKIFNIATLRDVLYFKLAVNNRTHQRAWKTDKTRNSILPQAQKEMSAGNSSYISR